MPESEFDAARGEPESSYRAIEQLLLVFRAWAGLKLDSVDTAWIERSMIVP